MNQNPEKQFFGFFMLITMINEKAKNIFTQLLELIKIEKQEDLKFYASKMKGKTLAERKTSGVLWYPVALEQTNYALGEHLILKITRPEQDNQEHQFQSGKLVYLFKATEESNDNHGVNAIVNQVSGNQMYLTLLKGSASLWQWEGHIGVQLLFDDSTYKEMEKTLRILISTKDSKLIHLIDVLIGDQPAKYRTSNLSYSSRIERKSKPSRASCSKCAGSGHYSWPSRNG